MTDAVDDSWSEATRARIEALDREAAAERARSHFHESIRRLHTSGVSLRDIARRLEISHQRVHQIVSDTACGFCGRRRADVERLAAGPGVFVCNTCVSLGLHALAQGWGARDRDLVLDVSSEPDLTCCFCRKPGRKTGPLVVRGNLRICGHCLTLAAATLEMQQQPPVVRHRRRRAKKVSPATPKPTPRAGQTLERAAEEAQSLRQPSLLPEHLLLGILMVPDSVGAKALTALGVDADIVRRELLASHPEGTEPVYPPLGMAPATKRVMELARSEAKKLNHSYLGTEHLVLALSVSPGPSTMLEKFGVIPELLQRQVNTVLGTR